MSKQIKDQQGFSHIEIAVIVVVIVAILGAGWWVIQRRTTTPKKTSSHSSTTAKEANSTSQQVATTSSVKLDTIISDVNTALDNESTVEQNNSDSYQSRATNDTAALKSLGDTYSESSF